MLDMSVEKSTSACNMCFHCMMALTGKTNTRHVTIKTTGDAIKYRPKLLLLSIILCMVDKKERERKRGER